MPEFDRFDEPNYSSDEVRFEGEGIGGQVSGAIEPIKKFLPQIIGIIAVAAVIWFAYDYFIGSMVSATVAIYDTEGKLLEGSKLKLFASGNTEPIFSGKDNSTYAVSLKPGSYRFEAEAAGYGIKRGSFEISAENKETEIVLQKDLEVKIIGLADSFPDRLYAGGTREFIVQLKNDSKENQTVNLLPEGDIKNFEFTGIDGISIPANSAGEALVGITVPAGTSVKEAAKGDAKTATFRVEYTLEKDEADFTLFPNPAAKIILSDASFSAKARETGNKDEDEITVKNNNGFPIENLTLKIEITSATKNNPSEVLQWFQFSEIANEPNPREIEISSIPAGATVKKELQVVLPLTAQKELDIKGNVVLDAPFLSEPKKQTLTLDITESASYGIQLALSPASPIKISWDSTIGKYEDKLVSLGLSNTGQLQLQNIVVSIANETDCSKDWLELIENSIDSLGVGETSQLKMTASAPVAVRGQEQPKYCSIRYRFDNPLQPGDYVEETKASFLQVAPQPQD